MRSKRRIVNHVRTRRLTKGSLRCDFGHGRGRQTLAISLSLRGGRHISLHPQILHHLSVMIECVGDSKCGQVQTGRFAVQSNLNSTTRSHLPFAKCARRMGQPLCWLGWIPDSTHCAAMRVFRKYCAVSESRTNCSIAGSICLFCGQTLGRLIRGSQRQSAAKWCARRDSNSRPVAPEATALSS